ncbi:hypothetical protein FA13DRAFT_1790760 [Coprinellus micaceus]|uniref:Uncharacterized protein n=1 Tax=Coprinellus micaceus TaxID=71717 RepID=A0A4Y7TE48_COPMI|nr:hypothetical protein FA13DRAFT_1790760 [Coprinellus micaceus]
MALQALPGSVLERIAYHVVVAGDPPPPSTTMGTKTDKGPTDAAAAYLYTPPPSLPPSLLAGIARLPPFLRTCRAIYEALSPGMPSAGRMGMRIPSGANWRRWGYVRRRKGADDEEGWDRDVGGATNEGLTAHFVQAVRTLRFFQRAAGEIGIPVPSSSAPIHPSLQSNPTPTTSPAPPPTEKETTLAPLYDPAIEHTLVTTFILMLEDDGKNHHQLRLVRHGGVCIGLCIGLFCIYIYIYFDCDCDVDFAPGRTHGHDPRHQYQPHQQIKFNDGWPVENVLNTAAVWCVWLFTTEEKVHSESLPVREALVRLVLPFVLCPYRYASALVPPTHYTLPLPASSPSSSSSSSSLPPASASPPSSAFHTEAPSEEEVYQKPLSTHTAHGQFPVYHSFPANAVPPPALVVPSHAHTPPAAATQTQATTTAATATTTATATTAAPAQAQAATAQGQGQAEVEVEEEAQPTQVPSNATRPDAAPTPSLSDRPPPPDANDNSSEDDAGANGASWGS